METARFSSRSEYITFTLLRLGILIESNGILVTFSPRIALLAVTISIGLTRSVRGFSDASSIALTLCKGSERMGEAEERHSLLHAGNP